MRKQPFRPNRITFPGRPASLTDLAAFLVRMRKKQVWARFPEPNDLEAWVQFVLRYWASLDGIAARAYELEEAEEAVLAEAGPLPSPARLAERIVESRTGRIVFAYIAPGAGRAKSVVVAVTEADLEFAERIDEPEDQVAYLLERAAAYRSETPPREVWGFDEPGQGAFHVDDFWGPEEGETDP